MNKFYINKTKAGLYYFTFNAENGQVIVSSGTYNTIDGCENGIFSIKNGSFEAVIEDLTND